MRQNSSNAFSTNLRVLYKLSTENTGIISHEMSEQLVPGDTLAV